MESVMADQLIIENDAPQSVAQHEAEMASKAVMAENTIDHGVVPLEGQEESQTFRPEKFQSDEAWRKSYDELERKFHGQAEEPQVEDGDLSIPEMPDAPFDMEALQQEYMETGSLTDKSYKTLEKAGISRDYADTYIAGVRALGEQIGNQVKNSVGGNDTYTNMVEWAQANYTSEQIQAYDNAVNSGDTQLAMITANGLKADYQNATGVYGQEISGDVPSRMSEGLEVFRSNAEITTAMKDPRYENDPAYRQDVLDRLERSDVFKSGHI